MTSAPELLFVVSGGRETGLGHVMRSAELVREALARGLRASVALRGDASGRAWVKSELPGVPCRPWDRGVDLIGATDAKPRAALFDTRDACRGDVIALAEAGWPTLVLDRTDLADVADATVLPVLHAAPTEHPRIRGGADWCIVPEAVRAAPLPANHERDVFLLSLGGADPLGLTERLLEPVARAAGRWRGASAPALHAVVGPSFARPDAVAERAREAGFTVHRALPRADFVALARRAAAAVIGFGTTAQELAWLGVPFVSFTHHESDVPHAHRLEARGVGVAGGYGGSLDPDAVGALLEGSLLDAAFRESSAARAKALLGDGRGAARILDLLLSRTLRADDETGGRTRLPCREGVAGSAGEAR